MLTTHEFSAGELNTARPISLLRPIAEHEREVLVVGTSDKPIAVILQDEYSYDWFETEKGENWTGLIIPNLRVEVDENSAFDARFERSPLGVAVRKGAELSICAKAQNSRGLAHITIEDGLPSLGEHKVGFKRWQLVLGEGREKRVIRTFDLTASAPA